MIGKQQIIDVEGKILLVYKKSNEPTSTSASKRHCSYVVMTVLGIFAIFGFIAITSTSFSSPSHKPVAGNSTSKATSKQDTICIVGAGPSGLGTASRLLSKGYQNIIVFKKTSAPGGKATNWVDPDTQVPFFMGPLFGTTRDYTTVLSYLAKYAIPYFANGGNTYIYNADVGVIVNPALTPSDPTPVILAYQKYTVLRAKYVDYLVPAFKNGIPDELAVPLYDWLSSNDMLPLQPALWVGITGFGYGSLKEIPTIYALAYVDNSILLSLIGQGTSFTTDFHALFAKVAETLPDVRYGVTITKTRRVSNGNNKGANKPVTLTFTDSSNVEKNQDCDSLVLAFPQRIDLLENFDLDKKETALFSKVKTNQYSTSIVRMHGPSVGLHANLLQFNPTTIPSIFPGEPKGNGQPVLFSKQQYPRSDYVVAYSWKSEFEPGPGFSTSAFDIATTETLSKVNRLETAPISDNVPITQDDIQVRYKWNYFPHVSTSDIKSGFYKDLEGLQGNRQTYFTSGLRAFETVEAVLRSAHDLVDRYF